MCKPGSCNGCMWWEQLDWPSDFSKWVPWNDRFCFPAIYSISLIPLQLFGLIISMLLFCTMKYRQNSQTYKSYSPAADSQTNTGTAPRHHADSFIDDWRSFLWISTIGGFDFCELWWILMVDIILWIFYLVSLLLKTLLARGNGGWEEIEVVLNSKVALFIV